MDCVEVEGYGCCSHILSVSEKKYRTASVGLPVVLQQCTQDNPCELG